METGKGNIQKIKQLAVKRGISLDEEEFMKLSKMLEDIPDVRVDKINKVREQIASGSYNPPLKNIVSASISDLNT